MRRAYRMAGYSMVAFMPQNTIQRLITINAMRRRTNLRHNPLPRYPTVWLSFPLSGQPNLLSKPEATPPPDFRYEPSITIVPFSRGF